MKILTLMGSPRKRGNTAAVLSAFEKSILLPDTVQRINLGEWQIHGCLGCSACQKRLNIPGCVQQDAATTILDQMLAADVLVYASPLYVWDFSAQIKLLLDRQFCLLKWRGGEVVKSFLEGKKVMLLVTCGGRVENNADLIQVLFERIMTTARCKIIGEFVIPNCTTPKSVKEIIADPINEMLSKLNNFE